MPRIQPSRPDFTAHNYRMKERYVSDRWQSPIRNRNAFPEETVLNSRLQKFYAFDLSIPVEIDRCAV
jgi:hypothetical protein